MLLCVVGGCGGGRGACVVCGAPAVCTFENALHVYIQKRLRVKHVGVLNVHTEVGSIKENTRRVNTCP